MSTEARYVTDTGRTYQRKPGRKHLLPREVRAELYQLHLTQVETRHEIERVLSEHGVTTVERMKHHMKRVVAERGR